MRIAILSQPNRKNGSDRLLEAALSRGHEARIIDYTECYCNIQKGKTEVYYKGELLPKFDAIIPRISIFNQTYGSTVIRQFEMMGTFTTTGSLAFIRTRDKLRSMQLLAKYGIGIPRTVVARRTRDVDDLIAMVGGAPLVIKITRGSLGVGVVLAETKKAARSIMQAFYSQNVDILIQEFIAESKGEDVRVFVVDNKIIAAMKRKSLDADEFRSNINLGGVGEPVELTKKEEIAALKAAKTMHLSVAGVDLLQSKKGPLVMEVNAFPMLSGIESATGINVGDKIIEYVERATQKRPKKDKIGA